MISSVLFQEIPMQSCWFGILSVFSMTPLLHRDSIMMPATIIVILFVFICTKSTVWNQIIVQSSDRFMYRLKMYILFSSFLFIILEICHLTLPPLDKFPDLHARLVSVLASFHFIIAYLYGIYKQWNSK